MKESGNISGARSDVPGINYQKHQRTRRGEVVAEMVTVGIRMDRDKYDFIIDRISHEVPYYRAMLKRMALEGTYIINNPFWWSADDKFSNFCLADKLGVAIPKTVLLPQHSYIKDIVSDSLRNLEFPIDWAGLRVRRIPAFLKPHDGGGWKNVSKIWSMEELWQEYNQSGNALYDAPGKASNVITSSAATASAKKVLIMPYDPSQPYLSGMRYVDVDDYLTPELHARVEKDVLTICEALGYDLNTVEFAIKDGVPYAIDFMNPAPDAELASVGKETTNGSSTQMTEFIFKKIEEG
ncbi:MAG: hypothetical protein IPJ30_14410 [Acidobacteria bacterium]|nr:hypothetical protein [Acidobacteriota bacterium]